MLGTVPIGAGVILAFNSLSVYITECYQLYAASALAGMAISRALFATACECLRTRLSCLVEVRLSDLARSHPVPS